MNAPLIKALPPRPSNFLYSPMFPLGADPTPWRKLDIQGVTTSTCDGQTVLRIKPEALSDLAFQAFRDVSHLLRPAHLASLRAILDDPEASGNDRFVALDLLKNANISAGGVLPMCQDTGTAIVFGKKGQRVWVEGDEEEALSTASTAPIPRPICAIRRWRRCRCSRKPIPATTCPFSSTSTRAPATTTPMSCI